MKTMRGLALLGVLTLAACGDDDTLPTTPPTTPVAPITNWSGTYANSQLWLVAFERASDGWRSSYTCPGTMTISQGPQTGTSAPLTGFVVVNQPCPPDTFEFTGSAAADGSMTFTTDGPRPPGCPAKRTSYNGLFTGRQLSARGTTSIDCSGETVGTHQFDYVITAFKTS
jgi:hypothetical protein